MGVFLVRRILEAIPVVFLATVAIFLGLRLIPGDPALILAGQDATPETLAAIRQANGLDQPLPVQYGIWLNNVVHGDLGVSFFTRAPVAQLLSQRTPATWSLGWRRWWCPCCWRCRPVFWLPSVSIDPLTG